MSRIAFMNASIAWQGIIFSAVEPRYRGVVFVGAGLYPDQAGWVAEANPVNFAPHIRPPKLMVNGRWDEDFAFKTEAEPLFKLLSEPKSLELYDGGHIPPATVLVPHRERLARPHPRSRRALSAGSRHPARDPLSRGARPPHLQRNTICR